MSHSSTRSFLPVAAALFSAVAVPLRSTGAIAASRRSVSPAQDVEVPQSHGLGQGQERGDPERVGQVAAVCADVRAHEEDPRLEGQDPAPGDHERTGSTTSGRTRGAERGIWRRTPGLDSYRGAEPAWETVLDIDALSKAEDTQWVFKGAQCLPPAYRRCLVGRCREAAPTPSSCASSTPRSRPSCRTASRCREAKSTRCRGGT